MANQKQKLALLVGIMGAGKSTVANSFGREVYVIHFDRVIKEVNLTLCPRLKGDKHHAPWLLEKLKDFVRFPEHIVAEAIDRVTNGKLKSDRPILAEGGSLSFDWWEVAFTNALGHLGLQFEETRMFWHCPSEATVLKQQKERGALQRKNEELHEPEGMGEKVMHWKKRLDERELKRGKVEVCDTSDQSLEGISEFLNVETPELKLS